LSPGTRTVPLEPIRALVVISVALVILAFGIMWVAALVARNATTSMLARRACMLSLTALQQRGSSSPQTTIQNSAHGTPRAIRDAVISPNTILGVHLANLPSMTLVVRLVDSLTPPEALRFQWVTPMAILVLRSFQRLHQRIGRRVLQPKLVGL